MRGFAFLALAVALLSVAQAVPAQPAQPPRFRAGTEVVEVDVIVKDAGGRFVEGLTRDDFEILEDGRPQQIQTSFLVRGAMGEAPSAPGPSGAPAAEAARARRLFVLVFDQHHMSPGAFKRLKEAAESFLRTTVQKGDVGGIVAGGRMIGDRLSTNREELHAAVRQLKPSGERAARFFDLNDWPRFLNEVEVWRVHMGDEEVIQQVVARWRADQPSRGSFDYRGPVVAKAARIASEIRARSLQTLNTLETIATELGRFPGRKTVVFLTGGFLIEENWARLEVISGRAATARVTFYTIDARGLERTAESRDVASGGALPDSTRRPLTAFDTWQDAPNSVAVDTGGFVVRNTNDFTGALAGIAADTSTYYVLGYSPAVPFDGKFRKIEVRARRPGVTVRARKGYVAEALAPASTSAPPAPSGAPASALTAEFDVARAPIVRTRLEQIRTEEPPLAAAAGALLSSAPREALSLLQQSPGGSAARAADLVAGLAHFNLRNDEEAVASLTRAVEQLPEDPLPSFVLGWVHSTAGRDREAVGSYRYAAVVDPTFIPAHIALADTYMRMAQPQLAAQALRAGVAANPDSAELKARLEALEKQRPQR